MVYVVYWYFVQKDQVLVGVFVVYIEFGRVFYFGLYVWYQLDGFYYIGFFQDVGCVFYLGYWYFVGFYLGGYDF